MAMVASDIERLIKDATEFGGGERFGVETERADAAGQVAMAEYRAAGDFFEAPTA